MPHVRSNCFHTAEVNWEPLSVVIACGIPYVDTHPCEKASMTLSMVVSFRGIAIGHCVKRSTIVSKYLNPFDAGIVTKSAFRCENRREGTSKFPMGGTTFRVTLDL